jgi:hypothetical protein
MLRCGYLLRIEDAVIRPLKAMEFFFFLLTRRPHAKECRAQGAGAGTSSAREHHGQVPWA